MYGYIYLTRNKVTGRIYVGQKKSNIFLGEKYLGSGRALKQAIQYYGKESFSVELLEEIDTEELMDEREIYWISFYKATDRNIGYNISEGGNVNRTFVGENNPFYNKKHSEETRKRWSLVRKGKKYRKRTDSEKDHIRQVMKGRKVTWGDKISKNAKVNPNYGMKGKELSQTTRDTLSRIHKEYWKDKEKREQQSIKAKSAWMDEEYRLKHIQGMIGKKKTLTYKPCCYCGREISLSNLKRHEKACLNKTK